MSSRFGRTARFDCCSYCRHSHSSVKQVIFLQFFSSFESGGITKHLKTGPLGNSEFCFPSTFNVPLGFTSGNIEVSAKQNSLFPLGPFIKCLIILLNRRSRGINSLSELCYLNFEISTVFEILLTRGFLRSGGFQM